MSSAGEENAQELEEYDVEENGEENVEDLDDDFDVDAKLADFAEESRKIGELQKEIENHVTATIDKEELDSRSVYIGNVDYSVTKPELEAHFRACGVISRVTILTDKWTGHPKGFAYIEFADKASVVNAVGLNESTLKGRQLKVCAKRTNVPSFGASPRRRARGGRGTFRSPRRRARRPHYGTPY